MDLIALVTHLADDRYDVAIRSGNNTESVVLLNEIEPGQNHWVDIDADDFMDIVSGEDLTAVQEGRINNYLSSKSHVATSRAPVRQWLQANLSADAVTRLVALTQVASPYCKRAGVVRVGLDDVRRAVRRIAKSHIVASGQAVLEV